MNMETIITLIQSLGFPIFIAIVLLYGAYKTAVWGAGLIADSQAMLKESITHQKQSTDKMVQTQEKIAETQQQIITTLQNYKL